MILFSIIKRDPGWQIFYLSINFYIFYVFTIALYTLITYKYIQPTQMLT